MSKLFKLYKNLKKEDNSTLYLFKVGIFYIFLDEDAKEISKIFNFKLSNLNDYCVKCGFPSSSFEKYHNILERLNYKIKIVDPNEYNLKTTNNTVFQSELSNLLKEISSIDIDTLSISQAYAKLESLKEKSIKILEKVSKSE